MVGRVYRETRLLGWERAEVFRVWEGVFRSLVVVNRLSGIRAVEVQ